MASANGGGTSTRVAVIGAGIMGSAMARNLVAAGMTTTVWDRADAATGPLRDAGAVVAASGREAVEGAAVVVTMLPTAEAIDSVMFDSAVTDAFAGGCVWVQMGTIGVAATLRTRARLAVLVPDLGQHRPVARHPPYVLGLHVLVERDGAVGHLDVRGAGASTRRRYPSRCPVHRWCSNRVPPK